MILLAGPSPSVLQTHRQQLLSHLPQAVTVAGIEVGLAMHNTDNHGIEHFGYVDGRSQPLLLTEDIAKERATTGTAQWDPAFPLKQALVRCPGGDSDTAFGSYLVFRKLDQNVADFKERESALSNALGLKDPKRAAPWSWAASKTVLRSFYKRPMVCRVFQTILTTAAIRRA
jgi:deferrochelatase/peroxidase EfeB